MGFETYRYMFRRIFYLLFKQINDRFLFWIILFRLIEGSQLQDFPVTHHTCLEYACFRDCMSEVTNRSKWSDIRCIDELLKISVLYSHPNDKPRSLSAAISDRSY